MKLTRQSKYSDLKAYFEKEKDFLPDTLDGFTAYYADVRFTLDLYLTTMENEMRKYKIDNTIKLTTAQATRQNLFNLYLDLQNLDGWNKKRTIMDFETLMMVQIEDIII